MSERAFRARLGRLLKRARERCGLTQRALADVARITDKYLSRIELGAATPSAYVTSRLAHALRVPIDELVPGGRELEPPEIGDLRALLRNRSNAERARAVRVVTALLAE